MNILFTLKLWKVALDCSNLFIIQKHSHSLFKLCFGEVCVLSTVLWPLFLLAIAHEAQAVISLLCVSETAKKCRK